MIADVLIFMRSFSDVFELVLILAVGFTAVDLAVSLVRGALGGADRD